MAVVAEETSSAVGAVLASAGTTAASARAEVEPSQTLAACVAGTVETIRVGTGQALRTALILLDRTRASHPIKF